MALDQKSIEEMLRQLPPDSIARLRPSLDLILELKNLMKKIQHEFEITEDESELLLDVGVFLEVVEAMVEKNSERSNKALGQRWAGALSDYRGQYSSLDLQKKALEWRGD